MRLIGRCPALEAFALSGRNTQCNQYLPSEVLANAALLGVMMVEVHIAKADPFGGIEITHKRVSGLNSWVCIRYTANIVGGELLNFIEFGYDLLFGLWLTRLYGYLTGHFDPDGRHAANEKNQMAFPVFAAAAFCSLSASEAYLCFFEKEALGTHP